LTGLLDSEKAFRKFWGTDFSQHDRQARNPPDQTTSLQRIHPPHGLR